MPEHRKIGILGGDRRMLTVAARLAEENECAVWGFDLADVCGNSAGLHSCVRCADPESAVRGSEAVILPLPCASVEDRLNCPLAGEGASVSLTGILRQMQPGTLLCGGMLPTGLKRLAAEYGVRAVDYFESEELQILNAVPTAEGALAACMREIPRTVCGMKTAVLGYGRVGRTLANRLHALGAEVIAAARSKRDLSWAETDGCRPMPLPEFRKAPPQVEAIFNTIPSPVIDGELLGRLSRDTVLFELASGGADLLETEHAEAEKYGIRLIPLPSLPGRVFPVTAGEIISRTVRELLRQHREGKVGA